MADLPRLPSPADYEDVGVSGEEAPAGNKESIFVGILETLQQNNFVLNEVSESADIIEENTASDESQSERRNRRINEENTDKPGVFSKAIGGLGAGVRGVGGILNKANPFQEGGLGTKMSILLISGVLFAISKFGDKLVKPLAKVLEMFDSDGGVLDKLKDSDLFKGVVSTFEKISEDIKARFETIKTDIQTAFDDAVATFNEIATTIKGLGDDVKKLLESITTAVGFVKGAYDSVMEYINSFDTRGSGPRNEYGDGRLDAFEMENLKNDLIDKAKNLVISLIDTIWASTNKFLVAAFAVGGIASVLIQGYIIRSIALKAAKAATAATLAAAGVPDDTKPSDAKDNAKRKSSTIKRVLTKAASAFTISTGATASTLGNTAATAAKTPGIGVNKHGRFYDLKTGRFVAKYQGKTFSLQHLAKYPKLLKIVKRLPFLAPIIGGVQMIDLFSDPDNTHDDKVVGMGRIMGGIGGSALFAKLGGALGTLALPGWGTVGGAILGAGGGYFAGEKVGEMLAAFMLGEKPEMPKLLRDLGNLGSILSPAEPPGTVAGPMISEYEKSAGVNDQYYEGEVPKMSILSASTGEYPQSSFASQLNDNLMNKNTALAIAAYQADKAANLKINTPLPGGRGDMPLSMPVVVDKGQVTNIQSNYGSRLNVDNGNITSRLFGDSLLIDVRGSLAGGF